MLDLHCIKYAKGGIDGLAIGMVGDLKNGRTVHSLLKALRNYDVKVYCVAPDALKMKQEVIDEVKDKIEVIEGIRPAQNHARAGRGMHDPRPAGALRQPRGV